MTTISLKYCSVIIVLFSITHSGCIQKSQNSCFNSTLETSEVECFNNNILLSEDAADYFPENIKQHKTIQPVLEGLFNDNYKLYKLSYEVLNIEEKINRTDRNYGINASPSLRKMYHTELKNEIKQVKLNFRKKYSSELNDSIDLLLKRLTSFEAEYTQTYLEDLKQIHKGKNYRNTLFLDESLSRETGVYELYRLLTKMQLNKHFIRNQLLLNSCRHAEYPKLVQQQKDEMIEFYNSEFVNYISPIMLFRPMSELLSQFKIESQKILHLTTVNEEGYSNEVINYVHNTMKLYSTIIQSEIIAEL